MRSTLDIAMPHLGLMLSPLSTHFSSLFSMKLLLVKIHVVGLSAKVMETIEGLSYKGSQDVSARKY